jgi:putative Mn2+ efflux pump MntP
MSIFRILKYRYNYYHTNLFFYNILMFLAILLSPIVFLACFVLPFVGTIFSREHSAKWVAFWLLQILGSWTLIPFFELFLEC